MCLDKKIKTTTTKQINLTKKNLAGARNLTRDLSHANRMRYHCTTETTDEYGGGIVFI